MEFMQVISKMTPHSAEELTPDPMGVDFDFLWGVLWLGVTIQGRLEKTDQWLSAKLQ